MLHKIWDKKACYEIYFRELPDSSKIEVTTYLNGDPFVNPRTQRDNNSGNTEVWDVIEARSNWDAWVTHGNYEVAKVEDYLQGGRIVNGGSMNYRKGKLPKHIEMTETEFERIERLNNE